MPTKCKSTFSKNVVECKHTVSIAQQCAISYSETTLYWRRCGRGESDPRKYMYAVEVWMFSVRNVCFVTVTRQTCFRRLNERLFVIFRNRKQMVDGCVSYIDRTIMMSSFVNIILVAVCLVLCENERGAVTCADDGITTQTNNGAVRGKVLHSLLRKIPFYSFKGIPYAKAPTGDLRFKVSAVENSTDCELWSIFCRALSSRVGDTCVSK